MLKHSGLSLSFELGGDIQTIARDGSSGRNEVNMLVLYQNIVENPWPLSLSDSPNSF